MKTRLLLVPSLLVFTLAGAFAAPPAFPPRVNPAAAIVTHLDVLKGEADFVRLQPKQARLDLNTLVLPPQIVRTGENTRAELRFADGAIVRLGRLTTFTHEGPTPNRFVLSQGSAFIVLPPPPAVGSIELGPVSASGSGASAIAQVFADRVVVFVYSGTLAVDGVPLTPGRVVTVPLNADDPTAVRAFDVRLGLQTAALFTRFSEADSQSDILKNSAPDGSIPLPPGFQDDGVNGLPFIPGQDVITAPVQDPNF